MPKAQPASDQLFIMPKPLKNTAPFINRQRELQFLHQWISEQPGNLLFIYGPKSSGKTTLLMQFIERNLANDDYDIKHFNLRELLITSYKDFIRSFFRIDYDRAKGDVKEIRSYSLPFFRLSVEVLKGVESTDLDALAVMKMEIRKSADNGRQPVIIIDELQALEGIYTNGQRELLKELFNFFVAISKESHLCHVIIASSDGYFVERIYNDSKLKKTSKFLCVDYLSKDDVYYWLGDLRKHSNIDDYTLSKDQIEIIWNTMGGSTWEIYTLLGDLHLEARNGRIAPKALEKVLEQKVTIAWAMFEDYASYSKSKKLLFKALAKIISSSANTVIAKSAPELVQLIEQQVFEPEQLVLALGDLVRHNFLAFDPTQASYQVQGRCMELGLLRYAQSSARL